MVTDHNYSRTGIILNLVKTGLEKSAVVARAQQLDHFVLGLHPTPEELQEAQTHPETRITLYSRQDVIQDLRYISLLEDQRVVSLLLSVSDEHVAFFLDRLSKDQLPFFTSDNEVMRLRADAIYRFKVNPSDLPYDMPTQFSAREAFFQACTDENENIKPNIDMPSVLQILSEQYPHN